MFESTVFMAQRSVPQHYTQRRLSYRSTGREEETVLSGCRLLIADKNTHFSQRSISINVLLIWHSESKIQSSNWNQFCEKIWYWRGTFPRIFPIRPIRDNSKHFALMRVWLILHETLYQQHHHVLERPSTDYINTHEYENSLHKRLPV